MQRGQRPSELAAKLSLAALLTALLLAAGYTAASPALHHAVQHNHTLCAICLLAQGQIELPETDLIPRGAVPCSFCSMLAAKARIPEGFGFYLPPGRAPPRLAHGF